MAAALFDRIIKVELQEMTKSNYWDNKDYEKYKLPETPNEPTGKGVLAKFEDADNRALYLQIPGCQPFESEQGNAF